MLHAPNIRETANVCNGSKAAMKKAADLSTGGLIFSGEDGG